MLFAEKGVWDVVGEQAPGVIALLIAFAMVLFFLWKMVVRYGDPFMRHLNGTGDKIDALVASNSCIPGLAKNVERVVAKIDKWPSDLVSKLDEAKCSSPMMTREEAKEHLRKIYEEKMASEKASESNG